MACVCPPQISMITQGRVILRRIASTSPWASFASRNSVVNFISLPLSSPVNNAGVCCRSGFAGFEFVRRDLLQNLQGLECFLFGNAVKSKTGVDDGVLTHAGIGHIGEADLTRDPAEVDLAHFQAVGLVNFNDFPGYSQTHDASSVMLPPPVRAPARHRWPAPGGGEGLRNRSPAAAGRSSAAG